MTYAEYKKTWLPAMKNTPENIAKNKPEKERTPYEKYKQKYVPASQEKTIKTATESNQQTGTQTVELAGLAQQVKNAKTNIDIKKAAEKTAYQNYNAFLNQETDTDSHDFLEDGGKTAAAASQNKAALWQTYMNARAVSAEAQRTYDDLLETYTTRMASAEKDGYYALDMDELGGLLETTKVDMDAKQAAAVAAENSYGAYINSTDVDSVDFLEAGQGFSGESEKQKQLLLQNYADASNALRETMEAHNLMEDTYNYRSDMQTISGMTDVDKIALEIYSNGIDVVQTAKLVKSLTSEQRAQLRKSGKYFQILTNPKKYLENKGYGEDNLSRLAETYSRFLNEKEMQELQLAAQAKGEDHPILGTIETYVTKPVGDIVGGLTALGSTMWHDMGLSSYNSIDVNASGYAPMVYTDMVRETVSDDMSSLESLAYDTFNDTVDSVILNAIPNKAVASGIKALGTFGSTVRDTALNGGSTDQAVSMGIINAGVDLLADRLVAETFSDFEGNQKLKGLITSGAVSGVKKTIQEEIKHVADKFAQEIVLDEDRDFKRRVAALVQTGISEEEAKKQVREEITQEMAYIAFTSFLSGMGEKQLDNILKIT